MVNRVWGGEQPEPGETVLREGSSEELVAEYGAEPALAGRRPSGSGPSGVEKRTHVASFWPRNRSKSRENEGF